MIFLVMEYVFSLGDMVIIFWMFFEVWLFEDILLFSEESERFFGCWFFLLFFSDRFKGFWEFFSGFAGLGGGDGEDFGFVGLVVGYREIEKAVIIIWYRYI